MSGLQKLEFQCGYALSDGSTCKAPRLKGKQFCKNHKPEARIARALGETAPVPKMGLESLDDLAQLVGDTINRTRSAELPPKQGQVIAQLSNVLTKIIEVKEKLDPKKIAKREMTGEVARRIAQTMSIEQAREILSNRDKNALRNTLNSPFVDKIFLEVEAERGQLEKAAPVLEMHEEAARTEGE